MRTCARTAIQGTAAQTVIVDAADAADAIKRNALAGDVRPAKGDK